MGFLLFIVFPLLELMLMIRVGRALGFLELLALLILSAFVGSTFARREGVRVWSEYQDALMNGREPAEGVLEGVLVLLGGALLILPGFISDGAGLILLLPWTRRWTARLLRTRGLGLGGPFTGGGNGFFVRVVSPRPGRAPQRPQAPDVIDTTGESSDSGEQPPHPRLPS